MSRYPRPAVGNFNDGTSYSYSLSNMLIQCIRRWRCTTYSCPAFDVELCTEKTNNAILRVQLRLVIVALTSTFVGTEVEKKLLQHILYGKATLGSMCSAVHSFGAAYRTLFCHGMNTRLSLLSDPPLPHQKYSLSLFGSPPPRIIIIGIGSASYSVAVHVYQYTTSTVIASICSWLTGDSWLPVYYFYSTS